MNNLLSLTFALFILAFLFSCGNDAAQKEAEAVQEMEAPSTTSGASKTMDYEEMAEGLCKCMTPMIDIQKKVAALSAEGKKEEIEAMIPTIEALNKEGDQCVVALEAKYGAVAKEEEEQANTAFIKVCPEVAAILQEPLK